MLIVASSHRTLGSFLIFIPGNIDFPPSFVVAFELIPALVTSRNSFDLLEFTIFVDEYSQYDTMFDLLSATQSTLRKQHVFLKNLADSPAGVLTEQSPALPRVFLISLIAHRGVRCTEIHPIYRFAHVNGFASS